jgi:hypothetical protein
MRLGELKLPKPLLITSVCHPAALRRAKSIPPDPTYATHGCPVTGSKASELPPPAFAETAVSLTQVLPSKWETINAPPAE